MKYQLPFGQGYLEVEIPAQNLLGILEPGRYTAGSQGSLDNEEKICQALHHPLGSPEIEDIIRDKGAQNAVVIVNDITRPTPYGWMLPPVLRAIQKGGIPADKITLIIALGIHRPHTDEENQRIFGPEICARYRVINHDCDKDLLGLGRLSNGWELLISRLVAQADLIVATGMVELHYFAGWSGGRKSILPGVAARSLIKAHHQLMGDPRAFLGNYNDNPVHKLMMEAARRVGLDFILNVVLGAKNEIAFAVAGDMQEAWLAAVRFAESVNLYSIPQAADVVIAACGGFPKDISAYQAQKALDAAVQAVKAGGTIIWVAQCPEGWGDSTFAEWMTSARNPTDIGQRFLNDFELGGHKAFAICQILKKAQVLMVSQLEDEVVKAMFVTPCRDLSHALALARQKHGADMSVIIMPQAPRIGVRVDS